MKQQLLQLLSYTVHLQQPGMQLKGALCTPEVYSSPKVQVSSLAGCMLDVTQPLIAIAKIKFSF